MAVDVGKHGALVMRLAVREDLHSAGVLLRRLNGCFQLDEKAPLMAAGGSPAPPSSAPSLLPGGAAQTGELEDKSDPTIWLILLFKNARAASQPEVRGRPV